MAYEIEKGVAIFGKRNKTGIAFPFPDMEVNDSFSVPIAEIRACNSAGDRYAKKHGMKYMARRYTPPDTEEIRVRIWRIL